MNTLLRLGLYQKVRHPCPSPSQVCWQAWRLVAKRLGAAWRNVFPIMYIVLSGSKTTLWASLPAANAILSLKTSQEIIAEVGTGRSIQITKRGKRLQILDHLDICSISVLK